MLSPSKAGSTTGAGHQIRPGTAIAPLPALELDEKFQAMREECARTLTLIERLRASPHLRFAITKVEVDDHRAWSRR